jgi:hypothetical protein
MSLNFNVDPYYDDFDQTKNFHRILFKPGYAVQARELTQAQTILQDQITKFADNIFKENSPVTGGQVTTNFDCFYVKLQETYNNSTVDVTQFENLLVQNATGTVLARVIAVAPSTGTGGTGDPATLILSYKSGGRFGDNDVIYDTQSNLAAQAIAVDSTGQSSVASIAQGVFYVLGNFVQISPSTTILDKYDNTPNMRVGLTISESIQDYIDDSSLLDPAVGASNYQAPGADRYVIELTLSTRPLQFGDDDDFIELIRINNGSVAKMVDGSVYNVIDDYFAKRDFETNGDYVVNDFKLTPKTNEDASKYTMSIGKGLAYVHGYRLENQTPIDVVSNRARTTQSQNNNAIFMDYGSYFYVDNVRGNTSFFDVTTTQQVDLHCIDRANVVTTNATTYNSTLIGTGYIRGLTFQSSTSDTQSNTYIYKAFVNDINAVALTGTAVAATSDTITLTSTASSVNSAYIGVNISITSGTDANDFRTITAYNGVTKVATVNTPWSITPDTTSVYALNFGIKDTEVVVATNKATTPYVLTSSAKINNSSKVNNLPSGDTILQNPNVSEMLFRIGNPFVSNLTDTSYTSQQVWRNVSFLNTGSGVSAALSYEAGSLETSLRHLGEGSTTLSSEIVKQNFTIVVTDKGSNTTLNVGDIVPWTTAPSRYVELDSDASIATLTATDLLPFTATIVEKVQVVNGDSSYITKLKNLITANTTTVNISGTTVNTYTFVDDTALTSSGQVYIQNAGLVTPGNKQSLYLSDVKSIYKVIDTKAPGTTPTLAMLTNPSYDVTYNYIFDNGQRDSYYDHASLTLKPGAPQPTGNLWVLLNYYQHAAGDGFFSIKSYLDSSKAEQYEQIPTYISKNGMAYSLRDCLDFRPSRRNAQASFIYHYGNSGDAVRYGNYMPIDLSIFTGDYSYYLGRKDKLVLSKDRSFQIIEGSPSLTPMFPTEPDGSLVIANLTHNPYTGYIPTEAPNGVVSDLSVEKVKHKRYTMQDIAGLENRINNVEYYTSLNLLEQKAQSLQIQDAYGLNRFKNGILVDDFSSFSTADTVNNDYRATINRRERRMTATQEVKNFPLKSVDQLNSRSKLSAAVKSGLSYSVNEDGFINYYSLPYTSANAISQKLASRTVNVNPFSFSVRDGVVALSPNVDNWVDTNYSPALLITDPGLQVFQANSAAINVLSAGDWQAISGTSYTTSQNVVGHGERWSPFGNIGYTQTTTYTSTTLQQNNILGPYTNIGNTYALNNGYITDISVLPYIRTQQIVVRAKNMLFNTSGLHSFFDGINVDTYVRKTNVIELTAVSGEFKEDDVVGYYTGGVFTPTARVVGVYKYPGTTSVRLYVAADPTTTTYSTTGILQNGFYNTSGLYTTTTANGTVSSTKHYGGRIVNANTTTKITLSPLASSTEDYYTGNTMYICAGTGVGQSATISKYFGANTTVLLSTGVTSSNGDIYSIGTFNTNESGAFYGIFNLPENTFHTGQRVFRVDNRVGGNLGSETTYAEGTFYSEGLQTTAQQIDFSASPAGAKGTFTQTNQANTSSIAVTYSPWDPVAQTFIVSKDNYPNGLFLESVKLFFASKPTVDNSPITLSIVGTLNGYPNGETLDHSIVTLSPEQVVTSQSPQFLDSTALTTFKFNAPVYIQPGVLYSFIVKSNSNQYTLWTASNGDTALASSCKNLPTDATPSTITKIGSAPYVGALFLSQNSQTWTADQNQSLMFVIDRCVFDTSTSRTIPYVVPQLLPQRTLVDQSLDYYRDAANTIDPTLNLTSNTNILVDAFNITTTDFTPTTTNIGYAYNATLASTNISAGVQNIIPGKFGTTTPDNIYLDDGKGERILIANSNSSFALYTTLSSTDDAVSPIISDAGLTAYTIKWNINNCELSNSVITVANGGSGYNVACTTVTVSAPTGASASQAYATANIVGGVIKSVTLTSVGSGYIQTPTISVVDANSTPGTGASIIVTGETSPNGGNAQSKYITKKVVLDNALESGDLNVYLSAYRPIKTDINVYYKILNKSDTQKFEDSSWQLMTKINNSGSLYSQTRSDVVEYTFAPGTNGTSQGFVTYTSTNGQTYTTFNQFAIKIVLTTTDPTSVPFVNDLRAIALPPNTNTIF